MVFLKEPPAPRRTVALQAIASAPFCLLFLLVGVYTYFLSALSIRERAALYQFDEDLAIYDQIVWNTSRGRIFVSTLIQHATNMLGDHFSPVIASFVPIYWVWPDPRVLLVGQSLALGLAAVPLFLAARGTLGDVGALLVAATYLIQPALHFVNLFQFHEIALLPLPLGFALLAIERGWRRRFFAATLVALLVKEEVVIVVLGLAGLWWLRQRDLRMAGLTLVLDAIAAFAIFGVILPHFSQSGPGYYYVSRYAYLGSTPWEMVVTVVTAPGIVVEHLIAPDRLTFLAKLLVPLAVVPLLGWEYLVAALPVFGYLLLAGVPDQHAIDRHYLTPLLAFLAFGTFVGVARIASAFRKRRRLVGTFTSATVFGVCAISGYVIGPLPAERQYDAGVFTISQQTIYTRALIAEIPANASVSTSHNLVSWFSDRERVYRFPEVSEAEYVILDWRDLRYPAVYAMDLNAFGDLLASPRYRLIDQRGSVTLFHRGDPLAWAGSPDRVVQFGDQIELLDEQTHVDSRDSVISVVFHWRALRRLDRQYTIFVHVVGPDGKKLGQSDSLPLDNLVPTDLWTPGHVLPDLHSIAVQGPIPPSGARIEVGLYELKTGARLPITARGIGGGADWVELPLSAP